MSNYGFSDYESMILTRLAPLAAPAGRVPVLRGFAGDIALTEAGLFILLNQFPAVLVEILEGTYKPASIPYWYQVVTVLLHVCGRSLRSQDEARDGSSGVYGLLADIRTLLLGWYPAADLLPLLLISETKAATGLTEANEWIVVYHARYQFTNPRIQEVS
jgi:hypothetical protein